MPHITHCATIEDFCNTYNGSLFHAALCDPPYHLSDPRDPRRASPDKGQRQKRSKGGGFMGKSWDGGTVAFNPETWHLISTLLYPGAFVMAFSGSRTFHRMACAVEDSGLTIHPFIGWCYGSGFPKATRLDTQIDKKAGKLIEREVKGIKPGHEEFANRTTSGHITALLETGGGGFGRPWMNDPKAREKYHLEFEPATTMAKIWQHHRYGLQALKPALEPICVAQKPYDGRPVDSITSTGSGALNIDAARISVDPEGIDDPRLGGRGDWASDKMAQNVYEGGYKGNRVGSSSAGRWPANFTLCHLPECVKVGTAQVSGRKDETPTQDEGRQDRSQWRFAPTPNTSRGFANESGHETVSEYHCAPNCPVRQFNIQAGDRSSGMMKANQQRIASKGKGGYHGSFPNTATTTDTYGDSGTTSRFFHTSDFEYEVFEQIIQAPPQFYTPKSPKWERQASLQDFYWHKNPDSPSGFDRISKSEWEILEPHQRAHGNIHPTIKPIKLTQWLATLLLPPPEYTPRRILIPFSGTGSEAIGALLAGWDEIVLVDMVQDYCDMAEARLSWWSGFTSIPEAKKAHKATTKPKKKTVSTEPAQWKQEKLL